MIIFFDQQRMYVLLEDRQKTRSGQRQCRRETERKNSTEKKHRRLVGEIEEVEQDAIILYVR